MILLLNSFAGKGDPGTGILEKIGFLERKDFAIRRRFDRPSFCLILRGGGRLTRNGKEIPIQAPFCLLNRTGDENHYQPEPEWDEFFLGYLPGSDAVLKESFGAELWRCGAWQIRNSHFVHLYLSLFRELAAAPPDRNVYGQMERLAWNLVTASYHSVSEETLTPARRRLLEIERYLREHCFPAEKLPDVALRFGMSYPTFRKYWQEKYRISPYRFLLEQRNALALEMLADRALSVEDVASRLGFENPRYFSRFFRHMNHCSPSGYRRNLPSGVSASELQ